MNDGPHRYEFLNRIDVLVLQTQLAHKRQPTVDHFFAHVAKIKMDDWSVWSFRRAALLHLFDEGLGETIAGAEFHVAQDGLVSRRAEVVILKIAVSVLIDQISALGASRFRDENARERQAGGMVLHEFHVLSGAPAWKASAMPSPVLMLALVVKGKARPHPPVHKITLFAVMAWILPDISCSATTP